MTDDAMFTRMLATYRLAIEVRVQAIERDLPCGIVAQAEGLETSARLRIEATFSKLARLGVRLDALERRATEHAARLKRDAARLGALEQRDGPAA